MLRLPSPKWLLVSSRHILLLRLVCHPDLKVKVNIDEHVKVPRSASVKVTDGSVPTPGGETTVFPKKLKMPDSRSVYYADTFRSHDNFLGNPCSKQTASSPPSQPVRNRQCYRKERSEGSLQAKETSDRTSN